MTSSAPPPPPDLPPVPPAPDATPSPSYRRHGGGLDFDGFAATGCLLPIACLAIAFLLRSESGWGSVLRTVLFGLTLWGSLFCAFYLIFWLPGLLAVARARRGAQPRPSRAAFAGKVAPVDTVLETPHGRLHCVGYNLSIEGVGRVYSGGGGGRFHSVLEGWRTVPAVIESEPDPVAVRGLPAMPFLYEPQRITTRERDRIAAELEFDQSYWRGRGKIFRRLCRAETDEIFEFKQWSPMLAGTDQLKEYLLPVDEEVCCIGRYDPSRHALVPVRSLLQRPLMVIPGGLDEAWRHYRRWFTVAGLAAVVLLVPTMALLTRL